MPAECVFCRIARHEIPVTPLYEDDEFLAFHDMNSQAPVHVLVIPRLHLASLLEAQDAGLLGRGLMALTATARLLGIADSGFRVVVNCGEDGGQTVPHLHFHLLGGRFMQWPPG